MFSTGRYSGVKHSTGRDSRVPESTGFEFRKKRKKCGIEILKLSTGENADIRHATGTYFDKLKPIMKHSTGKRKMPEFRKEKFEPPKGRI